MKLHKTPDCLEKLSNLFDRTTQDFSFANALCDVLYEVEKQASKYIKMRQIILNEHYENQNDGNWILKKNEDSILVMKKMDDLEALEFKISKIKLSKPEYVSPRELYYLKEFFDFE